MISGTFSALFKGSSRALPLLALLAGQILLVWSVVRFVGGEASAGRHFGMPPLFQKKQKVRLGPFYTSIQIQPLAIHLTHREQSQQKLLTT